MLVVDEILETWRGTVEIAVLVDDENKPCYLFVRLPTFDIVHQDAIFPNARVLSAFLEDELGIAAARNLLHRHNMPRTSALWSLNHHGYGLETVS